MDVEDTEAEVAEDCHQSWGFFGDLTWRIMLSSSRSGPRLELLWLLPESRAYRVSEGGVGTISPLPLALMLGSPQPARSTSRTSAWRMFVAALLAGERPREGSVANGTITGGDMPTGRVRSSSLSVSDDVAGCWDRKSMMPDQLRGSAWAGRYGLRAGVAGFGRTERDETTCVCTMVLGLCVLRGAGPEAEACTVTSAATAWALPTVMSASENRSIDVEVEAG